MGGDPLLVATLVGVALGIAAGATTRAAYGGAAPGGAAELIGFPGELALRALKMLVQPLIFCRLNL